MHGEKFSQVLEFSNLNANHLGDDCVHGCRQLEE
jgi:hypothetical protein